MFLFWKLVLTLLVGWFAVTRNYALAIVAASVWLVLTAPDLFRYGYNLYAGIDARQVLDTGHVDIRGGPQSFTIRRDGALYGQSSYRHDIAVPANGAAAVVEFQVLGLTSSDGFDFSGCRLLPSRYGLAEVAGRLTGACPTRRTPTRVYIDSNRVDDAPFYLSCWPFYEESGAKVERCAMALRHKEMTVNVVFRAVSRSDWGGVVNTVTAALDQSFTPVWSN